MLRLGRKELAMKNIDFRPNRRFRPKMRAFVRFEFFMYILLHVFTCYVVFSYYGLMFAIVAALLPVFPELYLFVVGIFTKNFLYVSVFMIFAVLVAVNAMLDRKSYHKPLEH